jgi:hypothetical protein
MLLLVQNKHATKGESERERNKTIPEYNLFNLPESFTMCSICVVGDTHLEHIIQFYSLLLKTDKEQIKKISF